MIATRRRIYLMRHGDVSYFGADGPLAPAGVTLTERGIEQARAAGRTLRREQIDRVVTSGLPRTEQTAKLVVGELDDPPDGPFIREHDLRELEHGPFNQQVSSEVERQALAVFSTESPHHATVFEGESIGSLIDRALPAFGRLCDKDWTTLLLVLHGAVNRALLSHCISGERRFFGHIEQAAGCINLLDGGGPNWLVRAINMTPLDLTYPTRATTMEETLKPLPT